MAGRPAGSVRVRTTFAAVVIVGTVLVAASAGLVTATRHSLHEDIRDSAQLYALDLAQQLDQGAPPETLSIGGDDELLVQILAPDGTVLRSSPALHGRPALARLPSGGSTDLGRPTGDDRFLAVTVNTVSGRYAVLVARSSDVVDESTHLVVGLLLGGLPIILLIVGVTTWFVVGRTLRPVDAIRREVDDISAAALDRRVPVPATDDEIARLAATMNQMLSRLEVSQDKLRRFVSDTSHELRSPVATIRQHVEVALAHPDLTTVAELAATIHGEDLRLERLVEDLLLLTRLDEGAPQARIAIDLDDLTFAEASRLRETTGMRIDTSGVSGGRVTGDGAALARVLRNLGDNAARHASSTVAFTLAEVGDIVVAAVEDDGPGVPAADRDRIFDRFVRLDAARARQDGGSGLGLAIVARVVAAHQGAVRVTDSPAGGARFEIRLPRAQS